MELGMIKQFVVVTIIVSAARAEEPKCSEFNYQERLLEKLIRIELSFEALLSKVNGMEENVNDGFASLSHQRVQVSQALATLTTQQADTLNQTVTEMNGSVERLVASSEEKIKELSRDTIQRIAGFGAIYTRWGRTMCPNDSTTIYSGYAAGSHHTHNGGPVESICLPEDPQWSNYDNAVQTAYIYTAEYEAYGDAQLNAVFGKALHDQNVPCAVCKATGRPGIMMVPARTECYSGWFLEYSGYLMTGHHSHTKQNLKCVDENPEIITGGSANDGECLWYFLEASGNLPNPPYIKGRELTCVVCTQ